MFFYDRARYLMCVSLILIRYCGEPKLWTIFPGNVHVNETGSFTGLTPFGTVEHRTAAMFGELFPSTASVEVPPEGGVTLPMLKRDVNFFSLGIKARSTLSFCRLNA